MNTSIKTFFTITALSLLTAARLLADAGSNAVPRTVVPADHFHSAYEIFWMDYVASVKPEPVDLIFVGDSITEGWVRPNGKPVWEKYYGKRALDFGQGGDTTQNVLWRFNHLDLKAFKPKVAVIMIGTNNTSDAPEEIAAGVKAVIAKTQETFKGIKVIVISILPNKRANEKMKAANQLIKPFADDKSVFYVDLADKFTPVGDNWKGLLPDHLHLTTEGYEMWAAELNPLIEKLIPAKP